MNRTELHKEICKHIHEVYIKKNHDYGNSVGATYNKYGIDSLLVRMEDKLNRLYTLTRPTTDIEVNDESIDDTLLDLANYAIITIIERSAHKQNKEE